MKLRIQGQGGPIVLGLTGDVADSAMVDWDKKKTVRKVDKSWQSLKKGNYKLMKQRRKEMKKKMMISSQWK